VERRAARMRYLRDRWMRRLAGQPRVRIHTSTDPAQSCGIGNVQIEGMDTKKLAAHLFDKHRIIVVPIVHDEFEGLRVTPNVYTTLEEVDLFAERMEAAIAKGLPA
jgi:selenocysteine lyase/cysteine desulfurase